MGTGQAAFVSRQLTSGPKAKSRPVIRAARVPSVAAMGYDGSSDENGMALVSRLLLAQDAS